MKWIVKKLCCWINLLKRWNVTSSFVFTSYNSSISIKNFSFYYLSVFQELFSSYKQSLWQHAVNTMKQGKADTHKPSLSLQAGIPLLAEPVTKSLFTLQVGLRLQLLYASFKLTSRKLSAASELENIHKGWQLSCSRCQVAVAVLQPGPARKWKRGHSWSWPRTGQHWGWPSSGLVARETEKNVV